MSKVSMVIAGEPCSKANSRRIVKSRAGAPMVIKSKKALGYVKMFHEQCKKMDPLLDGDLSVTIKIYYKSRRPDLDESLILDVMQGFVKEKHIYWGGVDKENPRAEIIVRHL